MLLYSLLSTSVSAGLPNITGTYKNPNLRYNGTVTSGALDATTSNASAGNAGQLVSTYITFDAHNSNTIYGNSETVTPKSLAVLLLIKY